MASGVTLAAKPTYTAQTQLFVATQNAGTVGELQQSNVFGQARVQSYVKTVTTPRVLQPVIDTLGLKESPASLAKKVTATTETNTVLINITVSDSSPTTAAAVAKAVADSLVTAIDGLEAPSNGGQSPVKLSIVTPAAAPSTPSSPSPIINLTLGALAGLAIGLSLAVLRSILDTTIKNEADVSRLTDAPILGGIVYDTDAVSTPLISHLDAHSLRGEAFRQLRTNLQFAYVGARSKTVLVTSSLPGEGKSTTATNLAIAMAQSGQSVVLVDADLRRPMIGEYLGLEKGVGLTTTLLGAVDVNDALQRWGNDDLYVLTSGQVPPNPSELLGSEALVQLLHQLEENFDAIVIDAPPLLPVTDAAILAQHVGGVAIVVGTSLVKRGDLEKALQSLHLVKSSVFGLILNRIPAKGPDSYGYSYYSPEENRKTQKKAKRQFQKSTRHHTSAPSQFPRAASRLPGRSTTPDLDQPSAHVIDEFDQIFEEPELYPVRRESYRHDGSA